MNKNNEGAVCVNLVFDENNSELHYVKIPENHIVIDIDIPGKSGEGIHLHYIY